MLLREDDSGVLAIGQPSHAWVSGQLARAWGNQRFGQVEPWEEVCLAAEQHDVGWDGRDLEPLYDTETGYPRPFMGMPLDLHLGLFTDGPRRMLSQSRYAALLVSMHGHRLYARRDPERMSAADAVAVKDFLAGQEQFQSELLSALRADPRAATGASDALVERNSLLIWTWDYLSLALCLDWAPVTARGCPTASGEPVDLTLTPGDEPGLVRLGPWPFSTQRVSLHCEGRRLEARSADEPALRAAFAQAPWETLRLDLVPG
jgi:hypothetical protein